MKNRDEDDRVYACCGCSCAKCEDGHNTGPAHHTDACHERFLLEESLVADEEDLPE